MDIILTFDTDWVHECAIEHILSLLDFYDQKATFFVTNEYSSLNDKKLIHEISLHPNFNNLLIEGNSNYKSIIDSLIKLYPFAKGFRSHSLTNSSIILDYFKGKGFLYDSNIFNPFGGEKYFDYSGLVRFTHKYVDLGHLISEKPLTLEHLKFSNKHLNILDFHPIHILLNTPTIDYYYKYKHLTNKEELKFSVNNIEKGIGDLFIELLEYLNKNNISTKQLIHHI